jgi:antirestriction protein ArdC
MTSDVYQRLTDSIVAELERGVGPWSAEHNLEKDDAQADLTAISEGRRSPRSPQTKNATVMLVLERSSGEEG